MVDAPNNPAGVATGTNGKGAIDQLEWPRFPHVEQAEQVLPQLHTPGAWTVARDRWERLVTTTLIAAPADVVWQALSDPAALKFWLATCHGSLTDVQRDCTLDFDDGEFFLVRAVDVQPQRQLQYVWRWLGIGQATQVTWRLEAANNMTHVTVIEEAFNPPWDWQTWNGGGWPGILEQLGSYIRTGTAWRWPWRRVGPYAQIELPIDFYQAWDRLTSSSGLRFWLQVMRGELVPDQPLMLMMGDASGAADFSAREIVPPGQSLPSFLPYINFSLKRRVWTTELGGRLWIEPAGWGRSICQVVHYNWENILLSDPLAERRILTSFWANAMRRAHFLCSPPPTIPPQKPIAAHGWS